MAALAPRRSLVMAACLISTWLGSTSPQGLLTVAQGDAFRSARASRTADISADGRAVAFESLARLVAADTDDQPDIYVLERSTGRVTLASADGDDAEYLHPRISGDGRYLVFEARAATLPPRNDIVLHDRQTGSTRALTVTVRHGSQVGWSRAPEISDDGTVVAFSSAATTLVAGPDANGALEDVYMVRVADGSVTRVSVDSSGVQPDRGDSILPSLSADGRWIAFASTAAFDADTPPPGTARDGRIRQLYLRDTVTGRTTRLTRTPKGNLPNGDSSLPTISADGRLVAFASEASNLLDDDENRAGDVFLYDRATDALSWVSRAADGASAGGESTWPAISGDGRFVAFQSDAGNLACARACTDTLADINILWDIFVFDRTTRRTVRVSEDELGGWIEASAGAALDHTGDLVAFSSRHPATALDRRGDFDLFVRDLARPPALTSKRP